MGKVETHQEGINNNTYTNTTAGPLKITDFCPGVEYLMNPSITNTTFLQQHLDCNLKTQCEDGRDETEHCAFSSPHCQGLVASRNKCLQLIYLQTSVHAGHIHHECQRIGGRLASIKTRKEQRCNQYSDCLDDSDEVGCPDDSSYLAWFKDDDRQQWVYVSLDGTGYFTRHVMPADQLCPDSHYPCQADSLYCLPVYTRCNGLSDCVHGEDEQNCETVTCPGFYRCRSSTVCVHGDHLCDGWGQCPQRDDELMCDLTCPEVTENWRTFHIHSVCCHVGCWILAGSSSIYAGFISLGSGGSVWSVSSGLVRWPSFWTTLQMVHSYCCSQQYLEWDDGSQPGCHLQTNTPVQNSSQSHTEISIFLSPRDEKTGCHRCCLLDRVSAGYHATFKRCGHF
ncbi:hypothetical protein ACOMHN_013437 [Nucella lapillus]